MPTDTDQTKAGKPWRVFALGVFTAMALMAGGLIFFQSGALAQMMGHDGEHLHGADGTGHDEVNMPGLRGADATPEESADLAIMFRNFENITREVTNLPNGIRTITFSEDTELMGIVVGHVVGMINRVEEGRDPQIIIQSATLDILFERRDSIVTEIETTDAGIVVTQTSDDPEVAAALQVHAGEVSAMVERGMEAVHEMMMQQGEG